MNEVLEIQLICNKERLFSAVVFPANPQLSFGVPVWLDCESLRATCDT